MILADKPDTVVVATGSNPWVPPFEGKDQAFVVSAVDVLEGRDHIGGNIAIIGGGLVGGETVNFLASHGNKVSIIEIMPEILKEEPGNMKKFLLESYDQRGVEVYTSAKVEKIASDGMILVSCDEKQQALGPFDYVVTAVGMRADMTLINDLEAEGIEFVKVGDSKKPGNALDAIRDGYANISIWDIAGIGNGGFDGDGGKDEKEDSGWL